MANNTIDVPPLNITDGIAGPWYQGDWFGGIKAPFVAFMGEPATALMAMFIVIGAVWIYSRRTDITVVTMIILGSMVATALPTTIATLGYTVILFGAGYALWKVYSKRGGY